MWKWRNGSIMKKKVLSIIMMLLVAVTATACGSTDSKSSASKSSKTSKKSSESSDKLEAPHFTLKGIDGKEYDLSKYKGKKVYIKFWASWCQPCLKSLPHTEKLAKEEKGFVTLTVVAPGFGGEKPLEQFKSWYAKQGYKHMPVLLDEGGKITARYSVRSYPTNAFVNSKGELHEMIPGAMTEEQIKDVMKDVK